MSDLPSRISLRADGSLMLNDQPLDGFAEAFDAAVDTLPTRELKVAMAVTACYLGMQLGAGMQERGNTPAETLEDLQEYVDDFAKTFVAAVTASMMLMREAAKPLTAEQEAEFEQHIQTCPCEHCVEARAAAASAASNLIDRVFKPSKGAGDAQA